MNFFNPYIYYVKVLVSHILKLPIIKTYVYLRDPPVKNEFLYRE